MKDETRLVHAGRDPQRDGGIVNPPVSRASTVLYPTLDAFARRNAGDAKDSRQNRSLISISGTPYSSTPHGTYRVR